MICHGTASIKVTRACPRAGTCVGMPRPGFEWAPPTGRSGFVWGRAKRSSRNNVAFWENSPAREGGVAGTWTRPTLSFRTGLLAISMRGRTGPWIRSQATGRLDLQPPALHRTAAAARPLRCPGLLPKPPGAGRNAPGHAAPNAPATTTPSTAAQPSATRQAPATSAVRPPPRRLPTA